MVKLCERRQYKDGGWRELGKFHEGKSATSYKGLSFIEDVYGMPMRLVVLESSTLKQKAEQELEKKETELDPIIKDIEKKQWLCLPDAEKERDRFLSMKQLTLFDCGVIIEKQIHEKWPRGRRNTSSKPKISETYCLHIEKVEKSEPACQEFLHRESCIVLISNIIEDFSDEDLVRIYKGQQVVENSFRMLKSPQLASVIYLKSPKRIEALSMILTFSLLLRALIQFRLREGLKSFKEAHPGEKIYAGWGGRPLENPTFKLLYEHSVNCYFEREGWMQYSFEWPSNVTYDRVEPLLTLMGLSLEMLVS